MNIKILLKILFLSHARCLREVQAALPTHTPCSTAKHNINPACTPKISHAVPFQIEEKLAKGVLKKQGRGRNPKLNVNIKQGFNSQKQLICVFHNYS